MMKHLNGHNQIKGETGLKGVAVDDNGPEDRGVQGGHVFSFFYY